LRIHEGKKKHITKVISWDLGAQKEKPWILCICKVILTASVFSGHAEACSWPELQSD